MFLKWKIMLDKLKKYLSDIILNIQLPQIIEGYVRVLREELRALVDANTLASEKLSQRFVPLDVHECYPQDRAIIADEFAKLIRRSASMDFTIAASTTTLCVVLGDTSSEVTELCARWATSLLETNTEQVADRRFPILISHHQLSQTSESPFSQITNRHIREIERNPFDIQEHLLLALTKRGVVNSSQALLSRWLEQGKCVIFLQGLTEALESDLLPQFVEQINLLIAQGNKLVIALDMPQLGNKFYTFIETILSNGKLSPSNVKLFMHIWPAIAREYSLSVYTSRKHFKTLDMTTDFDWSRQFISLKARHYIPRRAFTREQDYVEYVQQKVLLEPATVLSSSSTTFLLGNAGSGKTTLLTKWMLSLIEASEDILSEGTVPIFVTLGQLDTFLERVTRSQFGGGLSNSETSYLSDLDLIDCLQLIIEDNGIPNYARGFLERKLKQGLCVIFLDGFDEIASVEQKEWLAKQVYKLQRFENGNRIIISARVAGFRESLFPSFYYALELAEFERDDIDLFVRSWFADNEKKGEELISIINNDLQLQEIITNPLTLCAVAIIHQHGWYDLPNKRSQLYEYCTETFLRRIDEERHLRRSSYSHELKRSVMESLALELQTSHDRMFSRSLLLSITEKVCERNKTNFLKHQINDVFREIVEYSGVFHQITEEKYSFSHISLQEFLVACAIVKEYRLEILAKNIFDSYWHEVIVFAAGIMDDASDLLIALLRSREDAISSSDQITILLGRCLREARNVSNQDVLDKIYALLIDLARPWEA